MSWRTGQPGPSRRPSQPGAPAARRPASSTVRHRVYGGARVHVGVPADRVAQHPVLGPTACVGQRVEVRHDVDSDRITIHWAGQVRHPPATSRPPGSLRCGPASTGPTPSPSLWANGPACTSSATIQHPRTGTRGSSRRPCGVAQRHLARRPRGTRSQGSTPSTARIKLAEPFPAAYAGGWSGGLWTSMKVVAGCFALRVAMTKTSAERARLPS